MFRSRHAVGELPLTRVQVLTAVVVLLLAGDAREALAAALRKAERRRRHVAGRSGPWAGRGQSEATCGGLFLSVILRACVVVG